MKLTFNNLRNWRIESQYWNIVDTIDQKRWNRQMIFKDHYGRVPYANMIWGRLRKQFANYFGREFAIRDHYKLFSGEYFDYQKFYYSGPCVYIHTVVSQFTFDSIEFSIRGIQQRVKNEYSYQGYDRINDKQYSIPVPRSNREITKEYIHEIVFNWINANILYPEGKFRQAQEIGIKGDREVLKEIYRNAIERMSKQDRKPFEDTEDMAMFIQRRFNITPEYSTYNWQEVARRCRKYVEANGKPCKVRPMIKVDYSGLLDGYDGDIDGIEDLLDERLNEYPENAILI